MNAKLLIICFLSVCWCARFDVVKAFMYNYHNAILEQYSTKVGWFAPFFSGGGYCSEARSFVLALDKVGYHNLSIVQHGDSLNAQFVRGQHEKEKNIIAKYDKLVHSNGYPMISVCHSEPGAWYVPNPRYHTSPCPFVRPNSVLSFYKVGRTMFETDSIPTGWVERLNKMDEIWVPTDHSKQIFLKSGVSLDKLKVVPETVDTDFFQRTERRAVTYTKHGLTQLHTAPQELFNFLFVGKFEARKGIDLVIESYLKEFCSHDRVQLILLTSSYHSSDDFEGQIQEIIEERKLSKKNPPRYTILSNIDQGALPALYSYADVLVIPSHGEGWGRPHMEAMSCETPVIATNWSGPTAFINDNNGYLLNVEELIESPNWPGHLWAKPNITDLRRLMRHVQRNPHEVRHKGIESRKFIVENFSLEHIGHRLVSEFDRILRSMKDLNKVLPLERGITTEL